jgi:AcrR family transcriptional regulator
MGSPRVRLDPASASPGSAGPKPAKKPESNAAPARPWIPSPNGVPGAGAGTGGDADATGAPASKRVLRSQGRRTMRRLLDAAMVAFDRRGYHATRVNDIVDIAKTSHGTFYLYFSNKDDLVRTLVTEAAGEAHALYDALSALPADGATPCWDDVHGWVKAYSELWTRYAPLFRTWTDLATIDSDLVANIRQTFTEIFDALTRQIGTESSGHIIDPDVAGLATLALLDRFHYLSEFVGQPIDDVALDTITTMLYRALFNANA